ncbi:MAG TPA: hypothetical protein VNL95_01020 [Dehalococcoidia bacterium]|nr:hypothetical protein [Dehalococcoidia bacterium]
MERPLLVLFLAGRGESDVEELVEGARRAAALDCLEAALGTGAYGGAVVAAADPSLLGHLPAGVQVDADAGTYHFGQRLQALVAALRPQALVYVGGGGLPLLSADEWASLALALGRGEVAIANNAYSSDLVAVRPADALLAIAPPERDNGLARALSQQAGLPLHELPRTLSSLFDIDSPTDVAVLKLTRLAQGRHLKAYLEAAQVDVSRYRALLPVLTDPQRQLFVAGRVGSHLWRFLETETACRVRLLAEERGLEALGLSARSLLGLYLEAVGVEGLAAALPALGDAAVIDTRVLLAHLGVRASRRDRFLSDLGCWQRVDEPTLRELTRALAEAPLPVLVGGHSLVTGGLMALVRFAWEERDRGRIDPRPGPT